MYHLCARFHVNETVCSFEISFAFSQRYYGKCTSQISAAKQLPLFPSSCDRTKASSDGCFSNYVAFNWKNETLWKRRAIRSYQNGPSFQTSTSFRTSNMLHSAVCIVRFIHNEKNSDILLILKRVVYRKIYFIINFQLFLSFFIYPDTCQSLQINKY